MATILDVFEPLQTFSKSTPQKPYSAIHSGNVGDIIYSLPTAKLLGVNSYILNICPDPRSGRLLTEASASGLVSLLLEQPWIEHVKIINANLPLEFTTEERIGTNINFDRFRICNTDERIHILYRHSLPFNIRVDTCKPWINLQPIIKKRFNSPYVAVCLTPRYRRFNKAYYENLLADIPSKNIVFIGTPQDQIERLNLSGYTFIADNFLEIAQVISQAELFIGNPSASYAIAEALKVPRLVELPEDNNVYPLDPSGIALHYHDQIYIKSLIAKNLNVVDPIKNLIHELESTREQAKLAIANANEQINAILTSRTWQTAQRIKKAIKPLLLLKSLIRA